ncbi:TauD/TfdA family dioxygenase [Sphaerisporangium corydalis]|uniref:TauD/TfdA family dioxygenase n=1 Tax=Sphaerisporangium corydalis TaxID=1441875 RepID=A0ABV9EIJ5_9ACTN|nr:TauD/TfdA family dioxygenase [Sphaerisporangium corydalis]
MPRADVERAKDELGRQGWTVLRKAAFLAHGRPDPAAVLRTVACFGRPSDRDGGCQIWPVAPRTTRAEATFSVRTGDAGFHTDAQYHRRPEDVVCLFVVRPAAEGGDTLLLTARDAVAALAREPMARPVLDSLSRPIWSWTPPEVFSGPGEAARQAPVPVLPGDGTMRWRRDNLARLCPPQARAAAVLESSLRRAPAVRIRQRPGDVIVIDNHRTLHARSTFTDLRRHLLRVRLWTDS